MMLLALLLAIDAVLHATVVLRFGTKDNNLPFLVFLIIDAVLAVAVYLDVPYGVWASLILSVFGLIGLTVTFNKPQRDKTLDRIIWLVDAAVVLSAIYVLATR